MMLAESPVFSVLLAWLLFVTLIVAGAGAIPFIAWVLRRRLPPALRSSISLEPVVFGISQKTLRSPRHAILQYRLLMTAAFIAVLGLFLLPGIVALRGLGVSGLQVAAALVLPTFVVVLHARRRNALR